MAKRRIFVIPYLSFDLNVRVTVRVIPRASRAKVEIQPDGVWKVWVTSPPVEGEANEACRDVLAEFCRVKRSRVRILRGLTARTKTVEIDNSVTEV